VFVPSPDGNAGIENPEHFGGGPIDKHLIVVTSTSIGR
jgi:hypothetical protein